MGLQREPRGPALVIPELRVGGSSLQGPGLSQVPGSQHLSPSSPWGPPPKDPAPHCPPAWTHPVQSNVMGAHPPSGRRPWRMKAVHHGGLSCPGLCPVSSGRLCHPGIQHRVTHAWKMHKGRRGGTAVHHDRETRGVFNTLKTAFSHSFDFMG